MSSKRQRAKREPSRASKGIDWIPRAEWGIAILLTAAALAYHISFLVNAGVLWRDEVNSLEFARMPLGRAFDSLRYDSFPLLSTFLLRAWIALGGGGSDAALRMYGLLVGVLLLGALWLASRLFRSGVPLLSLALLGLNPWVVRTVDSIRPYGVGMVLIVATLGCVWKAAESRRRGWLPLAGALAILSVQCMYQNAFLLLGVCIAGAVVALRAGTIRNAAAMLGVGLVAALSLLVYRTSLAAARDWSVVNQSVVSVKALLDMLGTALSAGNREVLWLWAALAALVLALGIQSLARRDRAAAAKGKPALALFAAVFLLVSALLYLAALKAARVPTQPWYYVPLAVAVAPALDAAVRAGATDAKRRVGRLVAALLIAAAIAVPGWDQLRERRTNMDVVASIINKRAVAGDLVVIYPFFFGVSFQRYYHGPAAWLTIPPLQDLRIHRYDLLKRTLVQPHPIGAALDSMAQALRSGHHVWLVGGLPESDPKASPLPPAPLPKSGWYMGPYMYEWGRETANFLESHCLSADVLDTSPGGPVSHYENAPITLLSGWR